MRATIVRLLVFALALLAIVGNAIAVEEKKKEKKKLSAIAVDVVKVEIFPGYYRQTRQNMVPTTIEDKKKIAELLAFFPELGKESEDAGGWVPNYLITCLRENGKCFQIMVFLSPRGDLNCWSWGFGDWPLKEPAKFEKLMDSLLKKKR